MLALTTEAEVVLGGVDMFTPPVALASNGELPDWVVPGRKKVPEQECTPDERCSGCPARSVSSIDQGRRPK